MRSVEAARISSSLRNFEAFSRSAARCDSWEGASVDVWEDSGDALSFELEPEVRSFACHAGSEAGLGKDESLIAEIGRGPSAPRSMLWS